MMTVKKQNWARVVQNILSAGLTQAQVAELVGVSQSRISELNNGDCPAPHSRCSGRRVGVSHEVGTALLRLQKKVRSRQKKT